MWRNACCLERPGTTQTESYDIFEKERRPAAWYVCGGRYVFNLKTHWQAAWAANRLS